MKKPEVIVKIEKGIPDVVKMPRGITVRIIDKDDDGDYAQIINDWEVRGKGGISIVNHRKVESKARREDEMVKISISRSHVCPAK